MANLARAGIAQYATLILKSPDQIKPEYWGKCMSDFQQLLGQTDTQDNASSLSLKLKSKELTSDEIEQILTTGKIQQPETIDVTPQKENKTNKGKNKGSGSISKDPPTETIPDQPEEHPIIDC